MLAEFKVYYPYKSSRIYTIKLHILPFLMGNSGSYIAQSFPPSSKFMVRDIPDLSGWIIIVTGMLNEGTVLDSCTLIV